VFSGKHSIFARVTKGMSILKCMNILPVDKNDRSIYPSSSPPVLCNFNHSTGRKLVSGEISLPKKNTLFLSASWIWGGQVCCGDFSAISYLCLLIIVCVVDLFCYRPEKIVKILRTLVIEHKSHKRWRPWAVRTGPLGSMSESFAMSSL